jgi:hypothetical protein
MPSLLTSAEEEEEESIVGGDEQGRGAEAAGERTLVKVNLTFRTRR